MLTMKDRHSRRRPFTAWIKRVANLKGSAPAQPKSKKAAAVKNNPYPESGHFHRPAPATSSTNGHLSFSEPISHRHSYESDEASDRPEDPGTVKSAAPTLATNAETIYSDAGQSKAETSNTRGGISSHNDGGANSTFSSPNHSERSLTTTLTTIQSTTPSGLLNSQHAGTMPQNNLHPASVHFSHQYPVTPASAVPAHLQPQPNPNTYQAATAGNMLSDNASIMTLASSSKRRRRNSLDTNASVRALAPSSVWGGSRESLPLSVLSGNIETASTVGAPSGLYHSQSRAAVGGFASAERASVYSSSGVTAPALPSERNSFYAGKQGVDTGSIRSGLLGHGRTESLSGSVYAGIGSAPTGSPLASPAHAPTPVRVTASRRSSDWKEQDAEHKDDHNREHEVEQPAQLDGYDNDGDANSENVKVNAKDVITEAD